MTIRPVRAARHLFRKIHGFLRRIAGAAARHEPATAGADSYVGLFQGIIETDASRTPQPTPETPSLAVAAARTSGFVRLEVNAQKKATGCFLFFVDGKVLSGAIEGASEQTGSVEASFRLDARSSHDAKPTGARPVAAVGRLTLETRGARRMSGPAEDMTIRFV